MTTTTATTTGSAIEARDFSAKTTDTLRDVWTRGKMRHVIAALNGGPVAVVIEGLAFVGVTLLHEGAGRLPGGQGRVRIRHYLADGTTQDTDYRLETVGTIIALGDPQAKWTALTTYREEVSAAITKARMEHGEAEGRAWGAWTGEVASEGVWVRYTPHTGHPAFADQRGTRWSGLVQA